MIYMKDGKLLVAAGGLCSSCCTHWCTTLCACNYSGNDCSCMAANETPTHLCIEFADVRFCTGGALITELNGRHCIVQNVGAGLGNCYYDKALTISGNACEIQVNICADNNMAVAVQHLSSSKYYYHTGIIGCCTAETTNSYIGAVACEAANVIGYDGTADIYDPCTGALI